MVENDPILPPNLEIALAQYYIEPQPDDAFAARLQGQLHEHYLELHTGHLKPAHAFQNKKVSILQILRPRPIWAILAVILALLVLTGLVYALGRATGFIPGFGFTSNVNQVYVLDEPVENTSGGITLRLQNAASDENRFWVKVKVHGATGDGHQLQAYVQTPDGRILQFQSGTESATQMSFSFPALPPGTQTLTLFVVNLEAQNFHLPIRLRPAKPGEILPVQPAEENPPSDTLNGMRLLLENVAPASDHTMFQVSLQFERPNLQTGAPWSITLTGDKGQVFPVKEILLSNVSDGSSRVFETLPFHTSETLLVTLVTFPTGGDLPVIEDFSSSSAGFNFDPGDSPQVGQTWFLDETVSVGQHTLHVIGATLTQEGVLVFEFEPGEDVTGVMVFSPDPRLRGSTGGVFVPGKNITTSLQFDSFPTQPFEIQIRGVYFTLHGPWTVRWQPPVAPTPDAPLATQTPTVIPSEQSTTPPSPSNPVLAEIQTLAQKFDAQYQQGPGWVYIVTENHTVLQPGQTYPPPDVKNEMWYEVDAEGFITRSLYTDRSSSGQILQQAATVGNFSMNFTYGNSGFNNGQRYQISLKLWPDPTSNTVQKDTAYSREQAACENGNPCLKVSSQSIYGTGSRLWIDMQTGQQVKTEVFGILKDGKEAVTSTSRVLLVEKVSAPPPEILNILAKVVVP
jgi:hypothetical protein